MVDIDPALLDHMRGGDVSMELVGIDLDVAVKALEKVRRAVERVRHPDEPTEAFVSSTSRIYTTEDSAWFNADAADIEAFPEVAEKMFRGIAQALANVDGGTLRWTDNQPPPPEPRFEREHPIQLPETLPAPDTGVVTETAWFHKGGDRWSWARWDFSIPGGREQAEASYAAALAAAGVEITDLRRGSATIGTEWVMWKAAGNGVVASVSIGGDRTRSEMRIHCEADDNPTWRPFDPTTPDYAAAIAPELDRIRIAIAHEVPARVPELASEFGIAPAALPVFAMLRHLGPDRHVSRHTLLYRAFAYQPTETTAAALDELVATGLLAADGDDLALTPRGVSAVDRILATTAEIVADLWRDVDVDFDALRAITGKALAATPVDRYSTYGLLVPLYEPPGLPIAARLAEDLSALRSHRFTFEARGPEVGPHQEALEAITNTRAAHPYAALTPQERQFLLDGLRALPT